VVGFVDDNAAVRRRRIHGVTVTGTLDETGASISATSADEVLVTIPGADAGRLRGVLAACAEAGIPCRVVRREETTLATETLAGTAAE
jgi:FlaA1/EpsC-like NDP-sugar epimerase